MPTYEFRCPNGHTFELFHRISDAPSTAECPTCAAVAARAISGGAGLVFKGSGFYLTDYGKNAHRTSGPANKAPDKGDSGGSSGGSSGGNGASGGTGGGAASGGSSGGSSGASTSGGSTSGGSSSKSSE